ncbi:MAG: FkbM family methyltransferase [Nostochopsis sp.]
MMSLSKLMHRLRNATYLIEDRKLFNLYLKGGIIHNSIVLDKPWFHDFNISTVLDIGANVGQFAVTINKVLPKAKIYSFEPLPECFDKLKARMVNVEKFSGFNLAIGEETGELDFEFNNFSPSSSFLKMNNLHQQEFPETKKSQIVKVKVERLDAIVEEVDITYPLLIKIDTQGYEDKVLSGGSKTIQRATVLIIETSFVELYDEQPLFNDIYTKLRNWGFSYAGSLEQLVSHETGQILQADSIFLKR